MSTEAPRCSEFARSIGVLPPGTGLFLDRVVLVSVPLPWPKPALAHPALQQAAASMAASPIMSRLFASEPTGPETVIEVFERGAQRSSHFRWNLSSADHIGAMAEAISRTDKGDLATIDVAGAHVMSPIEAPTFLICTQGSHDMCCGTSGVALADEIGSTRPDYVVRRVSHTGGHRFSPTFLSFPEGRMWAFADLDLVDRIASDRVSADDVVNHARGWWGAKVGPAQVAEIAVRAECVGAPFVAPVVSPIDTGRPENAGTFLVEVADQAWHVDVEVARTVPTVACEAPGGMPAKPGRVFGWSIKPVPAN